MTFYKYHGTGNDFVLFDNRDGKLQFSTEQVANLCDRHFGIGADGLMLLEKAEGYDFKMVYYNSDGNESTMCGNGGRCLVAFAKSLGIITNKANFIAIDGPHTATINDDIVDLHMQDVDSIEIHEGHSILNTGSPHYVRWVTDVVKTDVFNEGGAVRYSEPFMPSGINVNFVQRTAVGLLVRTYERGVEDETLSCGTGVTAAAIAATGIATGTFNTKIETPGGELTVSFIKTVPDMAKSVILSGPATFVFKGDIV